MAHDTVAVLVENHRAFLAFLERRVGDRALAEDILQEAFVRSLGKAGELRDQEAIVPWFYRVLRNAVIDHRRRGATSAKALDALASELETEAKDGEANALICRCVNELATTLKPEHAEVLRRVELDGVLVKDYAAEAGISSSNAGVRIFRARDALRKQVERACGTCATHGCFDCTCGS